MTLRRKTFLVVTATLLLLILFLSFLTRLILLNSYLQLEETTARSNTSRVLNAFENELRQLSGTTADWAYWDDTYFFVQDLNEEFVTGNLGDDTLIALDLNFMVFVDKTGQVAVSKFVDLNSEEAFVPSFDPQALVPLLSPDENDLEADVRSIVLLADQPVMVASRHILTSLNEGPREGVLIFGRFLNEDRIAYLSQTLNIPFTLHPLSDLQLAPNLENLSDRLRLQDIVVEPVDSDSVAGYTLIYDRLGRANFLLSVQTPRDIYQQGLSTVRYFVANFLIVGLLFIMLTLLLIDRLVLKRLNRLSHSVDAIRRTGDLLLPITTSGEDELSNLAQLVRELLAEIAESKQALEQANIQLEQRVQKRTDALVKANRTLLVEIEERKQVEEKLAEARDQALEALKLKTQILANISHDARTPLSIISLRTEMLLWNRYGEINETQKKPLETILAASRDLLQFINNLLTESQAASNKIIIMREDVNPPVFLQEVDGMLRPLAEEKGLKLNMVLSPDLPDHIIGDAGKLKQILSNLIGNAIKFTEKGTVTVKMFKQDPQTWAISVSDTGPGIQETDIPRLFEPFWQANGSVTRKTNRGVGLGLSIVKQLTTLMGGEIAVASSPAGTTFTVSLPLQAIESEEESREHV